MSPLIQPKRSFVMVRIPAGEFIMGSRVGQGDTDEFPPHPIWQDGFLIGRYAVTGAEWANFLNRAGNPDDRYFRSSNETTVVLVRGRYYARRGCADHPANGVTWYGARHYCQWLSDITGRAYRLPTESEWEYAARGGLEGKRYPWGNGTAQGMAQYQQVWIEPRFTLSPVDAYVPNPYGLYNMVGNVCEWCADWYDRNYYQNAPYQNPAGPEEGDRKVLRGGSWGGQDIQVRCGIRVGEWPEISDSRIGFRLARSF